MWKKVANEDAAQDLKDLHRAAWEESLKLGLLQCCGCFRKARDNEEYDGGWQVRFPLDPSQDEREEARWFCPGCNTHLEILQKALKGEFK